MSHSSLSLHYNALDHVQRIWGWFYLEKCFFFTKWARRQRTCMYERIVRDISLSFNELRVAPLWFLWNLYLGFWKPGYEHFLWPPSSVSLLTGFDLTKTIDHNAPCLPPKVLHNHCLRFSLRRLLYLPEIGRNCYTKFGRGGRGGGGWTRCIMVYVKMVNWHAGVLAPISENSFRSKWGILLVFVYFCP